MWTPQELQMFFKAVETIPESSGKVDAISEVMNKPREEVESAYEKFNQIQEIDAQIIAQSAWSVRERQRFQYTFSMIPDSDEKLFTMSTLLNKPMNEICAYLTELSRNTSPPKGNNNISLWSIEDIHRLDLAMSKIPKGEQDRMYIIATIIDKPLNEVVEYSSQLDLTQDVTDQSIVPFAPFLPEKNSGHWTAAEHEAFVGALESCKETDGRFNWGEMSKIITTRTTQQLKDHYHKVVKKNTPNPT